MRPNDQGIAKAVRLLEPQPENHADQPGRRAGEGS